MQRKVSFVPRGTWENGRHACCSIASWNIDTGLICIQMFISDIGLIHGALVSRLDLSSIAQKCWIFLTWIEGNVPHECFSRSNLLDHAIASYIAPSMPLIRQRVDRCNLHNDFHLESVWLMCSRIGEPIRLSSIRCPAARGSGGRNECSSFSRSLWPDRNTPTVTTSVDNRGSAVISA